MGTAVNRSISLECEVEAFPYAVHFWERKGEILDNSDKYSMARIDISNYNYKFIMQLNISSVNDADNGTYYCVSKNVEGTVAGNITLNSKYINYNCMLINNLHYINFKYYSSRSNFSDTPTLC